MLLKHVSALQKICSHQIINLFFIILSLVSQRWTDTDKEICEEERCENIRYSIYFRDWIWGFDRLKKPAETRISSLQRKFELRFPQLFHHYQPFIYHDFVIFDISTLSASSLKPLLCLRWTLLYIRQLLCTQIAPLYKSRIIQWIIVFSRCFPLQSYSLIET